MNKHTSLILNNRTEFLYFLRSKFHLYHKSNLFFRDLHYGVLGFLEKYDARLGYKDAERIVNDVAHAMVAQNIFKPVDARTWMLDYAEFQKPSVKTPAPAKPAVASQQVQKPAGEKKSDPVTTQVGATQVQSGTTSTDTSSGQN